MPSDSTQNFFEDESAHRAAGEDAAIAEGRTDPASLDDLLPGEAEGVAQPPLQPMEFRSRFVGQMELCGDPRAVIDYLDAHHGWFCRCAQPMQAQPIGQNGYILVIGRYQSFGYTVEPKIALDLLPQREGVYRIQTLPLLEGAPSNYQVDFQAEMQLVETTPTPEQAEPAPAVWTRIEWRLDLGVEIVFPRFIYRLPQSLLQKTGDRLLAQIVRQVSQRLTSKVQDDFHTTLGISPPKRWRRHRILKA